MKHYLNYLSFSYQCRRKPQSSAKLGPDVSSFVMPVLKVGIEHHMSDVLALKIHRAPTQVWTSHIIE